MSMDTKTLNRLIQTASGRQAANLVLKNAKILNVFTEEFLDGDIAIIDGMIAGIGRYDTAERIEDLKGRFVVPGFINSHCHVESSMFAPGAYVREELRWGTTTLITDPHEIANVAGIEGVRFMLDATSGLPVNYYVQAPSCVPATPFEHAGAELGREELTELLGDPRVLGLGEMMNYPGVISCDKAVLERLALAKDKVVDGHAPALTGRKLQAYAAAGIATDHESNGFDEAREKLRAGMAVLVREGSACKNLDAIISGVVAHKLDTGRIAFCTDDKHIADIRREGTIRHCIRRAIALGLAPASAYRIASYNAAQIYGLKHLGAVAPGYRADLVVIGDLAAADVQRVYKGGWEIETDTLAITMEMELDGNSVRVAEPEPGCFALPEAEDGIYPVVNVLKKQIVTKKSSVPAEKVPELLANGGLCKLAVLERHHATGNIGLGLLAGYGLRDGAVASTVAHDSHNLIVVGTNDRDMLLAVRETQKMQGGYALVRKGEVVGTVPLPIYGLMSNEQPDQFIGRLEMLIQAMHDAGVDSDIDPFITLSFLALPVIPEIRVTDMGVFDVEKFCFL